MKAAQIEKLLAGIMHKLVNSIPDDNLKLILENNTFITGGCIPSMLLGEYVNDYDIYFKDKEAADIVVAYYKCLKPTEEQLKLKGVFLPKLITENSINLTDKIQLIIKFIGPPDEIVPLFDWQHIKSYYSINEGLKLTYDVYKLIVEKELVYTGSNYPLSSLLRLRKFIKKGWTVSTKTMVHIVLDIIAAFESPRSEYLEKIVQPSDRPIEVTSIPDLPDITPLEFNKDFDYQKNDRKVSVDTLISQLNGVDPLTIQAQLEEQTGKHLSLKEVLELL